MTYRVPGFHGLFPKGQTGLPRAGRYARSAQRPAARRGECGERRRCRKLDRPAHREDSREARGNGALVHRGVGVRRPAAAPKYQFRRRPGRRTRGGGGRSFPGPQPKSSTDRGGTGPWHSGGPRGSGRDLRRNRLDLRPKRAVPARGRSRIRRWRRRKASHASPIQASTCVRPMTLCESTFCGKIPIVLTLPTRPGSRCPASLLVVTNPIHRDRPASPS